MGPVVVELPSGFEITAQSASVIEAQQFDWRPCRVEFEDGDPSLLPAPNFVVERAEGFALQAVRLDRGLLAIPVDEAGVLRIECETAEDALAIAAGVVLPAP